MGDQVIESTDAVDEEQHNNVESWSTNEGNIEGPVDQGMGETDSMDLFNTHASGMHEQSAFKLENEEDKETEKEKIGMSESVTSEFPPGFNGVKFQSSYKDNSCYSGTPSVTYSGTQDKALHLKKKCVEKGSLIEELERYIEIGSTLGYNLNGCKDDISKLIDSIGGKGEFK